VFPVVTNIIFFGQVFRLLVAVQLPRAARLCTSQKCTTIS